MRPQGRWLRTLAPALALAAAAVATGAAAEDPSARQREDLAAARAATERRDHARALPLFQRLVERDPTNADLLIEAARVHGWADRNAEAARLYRRALVVAPQRRADVLPSLAWQTLWAGDAALSLTLFEEWLRTAPAGSAAEALDGLAQARRSTGDTEGAIAALREAQALRPGDAGLARRLAAVLNDAGRHRAALRVLGRRLPVDAAERAELARTWRWAGYEDRALPLLADTPDPQAQWLRDYRVAREVRPYGYASLDHSEDRDGLRTRAVQLGAGWPVRADALVEVNARQVDLSDGSGSPRLHQWQALGRWRLGEPDSDYGTLWPLLSLRLHQGDGWSTLLPAARLKWIVRDGWRIDGELGRELIEAPRALAQRVHVDVAGVGLDWRRDSRLGLAGGLAMQRFDDGTSRWRGAARGEWALMQRPRWVLGAEVLRLQRWRDGEPGADARGYWSPRRYDEMRVTTGVSYEWRPLDLQARVGLGRSSETDGAGNRSKGSPHLWELNAAADLAPALRLGLALGGAGHNGGLTAGSGGAGYWRRWANLTLNGWF